MADLPAYRRQHMQLEYAGLKQACPDGIILTPSPNNPVFWTGVLFVRKGPYAPAILRFTILFPPTFPSHSPPLITFLTDIFHPLVMPSAITGGADGGTVSSRDGRTRLGAGGFSLRGGFPGWFGKQDGDDATTPRQRVRVSTEQGRPSTPPPPRQNGRSARANGGRAGGEEDSDITGTPDSNIAATPPSVTAGEDDEDGTTQTTTGQAGQRRSEVAAVSVYDVLDYVKSSFDDASILDAVPLEAAANPGAWSAWRAHRVKEGVLFSGTAAGEATSGDEGRGRLDVSTSLGSGSTKAPAEWNWDGVWEERVKRGVKASQSEAVLYGAGGGDDGIQFLKMDSNEIDTIKAALLSSLST